MSVSCPIECIHRETPGWLEKHEGFVLTLVATISGIIGVILTYFLKSRCKKIDCMCVKCDRDVLSIDPNTIEFPSNH